jgi:HTH-type transcriptional regulator/antitoxin HipB
VTTTSARRDQIVASLRDPEYRDLLVAEEIDTGLPLQIRAMRQDRGWSQRDLAKQAGMRQEVISRLEQLDYGKYTITTLKRLASAFGVGLDVRFVPLSTIVDRMANLSPEDLAVPDYEHDLGLKPAGRFDAVLRADTHDRDVWVRPAPPPPPDQIPLRPYTAAQTLPAGQADTNLDVRSA